MKSIVSVIFIISISSLYANTFEKQNNINGHKYSECFATTMW